MALGEPGQPVRLRKEVRAVRGTSAGDTGHSALAALARPEKPVVLGCTRGVEDRACEAICGDLCDILPRNLAEGDSLCLDALISLVDNICVILVAASTEGFLSG